MTKVGSTTNESGLLYSIADSDTTLAADRPTPNVDQAVVKRLGLVDYEPTWRDALHSGTEDGHGR